MSHQESRELWLYTTSACQLCERAERLLDSMPELRRWTRRDRDIALDDDLMARYATRIPVLSEPESGAELDWPFNADDVLALIETRSV